jgi:hypothetical protein
MTVAQLKLLMHAVGIENSSFMRILEDKNIIPRGTSLLRYKEDRIKVMMWYYLNQEKPININYIPDPNPDPDLSIFDCPICLNPKDASDKVISNCNHAICKPCLIIYLNHLTNNQIPCCSLCRAEITTLRYLKSNNI